METVQLYITTVIFGLLVFLTVFTVAEHSNSKWCNSPCTVQFPKNTQEDDFRYDYLSGGKLYVWTRNG